MPQITQRELESPPQFRIVLAQLLVRLQQRFKTGPERLFTSALLGRNRMRSIVLHPETLDRVQKLGLGMQECSRHASLARDTRDRDPLTSTPKFPKHTAYTLSGVSAATSRR
ncbi:hypothetical protein A5669_05125 [Mycolicibacterium fortuitum]|nr:hypothetical protein A5669_05125 [Mycolicibacterium fortuitum]